MAWTTPRTWVALEKVTAALLNTHLRDNLTFLTLTTSDNDAGNSRTFTNTSHADLDALTGGSGTVAAVAVTVTTGERALVTISPGRLTTSAGVALLGFRVSGATVRATDDNESLQVNATGVGVGASKVVILEGLTAGSNTFELQARVTAGTGTIASPGLIVQPLPG